MVVVWLLYWLLYWFRTGLVGLVLGNSTQRRVNHPACARVLAMHRGVGGVLGPFTCGFRAGVGGERMGVPGRAWLRRVRCHERPGGSGGVAQVRPAGAGVAVAVGKAAGVAAAGVEAAGVLAAVGGGHDSGGCGIGEHDADMQWSSRSVTAAVWPQRQCGSGISVASAAR